jgi:hypothetical protein
MALSTDKELSMGFGKHDCGVERVCIPLDALKAIIAADNPALKSISLGPKSAGVQYVCPQCDAYALGIESKDPTPFLCADGVVRTASDLDGTSKGWQTQSVGVAGFSFSPTALASISKQLDRVRQNPDALESNYPRVK